MYRIKQLREELGWTQEYLGTLINVNKSAVSKYEHGRNGLAGQNIINLSRIFKVSSDYLLGISPFRTPTTFDTNCIDTSCIDSYIVSEKENYIVENTITPDDKKILQYYHRLNDENKDDIKGQMIRLYREQKHLPKKRKIEETVN